MPTSETALSALRDLLYEEPSEERWQLLCHLLDAWDTSQDTLTIAVRYAQGHLKIWPDALRKADPHWWKAAEQNQHEPRLSLARHLSLMGYGGGVGRAQTVARCAGLAHMTLLNLSNNAIKDEGLTALAASPYIHNVQNLDVGTNRIADEGIRALGKSTQLKSLETLDLTYNPITEAGALALAQAPWLGQLRTLALWHTQIGPRGAIALADAGPWPVLDTLDLGSNQIGDVGARAIAAAIPKNMPALQKLNLSGNQLSVDILDSLQRNPALSHLEMNLSGNISPTIYEAT